MRNSARGRVYANTKLLLTAAKAIVTSHSALSNSSLAISYSAILFRDKGGHRSPLYLPLIVYIPTSNCNHMHC